MQTWILRQLICLAIVFFHFSGCGDTEPMPQSTVPSISEELIFYSWSNDLPQSVIDAFTAEYGVKIIYESYETSHEAIQNLMDGKIYDVMVIDSPYVPELAREGLLAEIDYRNVPNVKHISANFRDLVFDPGNRYSVTYNWGLTGLLVRKDKVSEPVTHWADLWDSRFAGRVLLWDLKRSLIGITLKSLGYSINSEDPGELEAALERLLELKATAHIVGYDPEICDQALANGEVVLMYGWAGDVLRARALNLDIDYVLPAEGNILWGDNFVLPAAGKRKYTAEVFINFLLRPEISARIVNEQNYATANETAYPLIKPEILNDPVIFPPIGYILSAEVYMPLSPEGKILRDLIWQRFLNGAADDVPKGD